MDCIDPDEHEPSKSRNQLTKHAKTHAKSIKTNNFKMQRPIGAAALTSIESIAHFAPAASDTNTALAVHGIRSSHLPFSLVAAVTCICKALTSPSQPPSAGSEPGSSLQAQTKTPPNDQHTKQGTNHSLLDRQPRPLTSPPYLANLPSSPRAFAFISGKVRSDR